MPKPEWGVKRTCTSCRTRFYDLQRNPVVCPQCGAEIDLSESVKVKRGGAARTAPETAPAAEDLVYDEEEEGAGEAADEVEDEDVPLAVEDEKEEEEDDDEVAAPKKGAEPDADLEEFDEDTLAEDEEDDEDDDLGDLDNLDEDDDLKDV